MITREQIPAVLNHPVHDTRGNKIGDARHVFFDDVTGRPEWVSVKTGLFGSNESFIPIHDASLVQDHLEVPYAKDEVKGAPNVDVDAGGHLSAQEEHRLYDYYGMDWGGGARQKQHGQKGMQGRQGQKGMPGGDGTGGTGRYAAATAGAAGAAGTGTAGTGTAGTRRPGAPAEESMTRYEEEMHVGTERREAGHVRLHKYVVTEEEQQTVPVRHEEVRIEREPITDAERGDGRGRTGISEEEIDVPLHREEPVVETRAVPKERIRVRTDEVTEEETVTGQVRKERVDVEEANERDQRRPRR